MRFKDGFPQLRGVVPEAKCGTAEVQYFEMSEEASRKTAVMVVVRNWGGMYCSPGEYIKLIVDGKIMMSDTDMEKRSNLEVIDRAHGSVLIAGLGLGLVTAAICRKKEVKEVVVIERNPDVIKLVEPYIRHKKLRVIQADIFDWKPEKGKKFDTIYFDIWPTIDVGNLEDIGKLHHRFKYTRNRANPRSWMSSWMVDELRAQWRREKDQLCYLLGR